MLSLARGVCRRAIKTIHGHRALTSLLAIERLILSGAVPYLLRHSLVKNVMPLKYKLYCLALTELL